MKGKKLKSKYLKLNSIKKKIKTLLKEDNDINDVIKENIDNKFLKFIQIKKSTIIFRANKKMRDEMEKNINYLYKYINNFLYEIMSDKINVSDKELSIITKINYFDDDNKIYVEF